MNIIDRRRTTFAVILTVVALPALWAINRDEPSNAPTAAAGVAVPAAAATATPDTYVPQSPVFLDGAAPPPPPVVIEVDQPPASDGTAFDGRATFRRMGAADSTACSSGHAPRDHTLTVTNIDNGLSLKCSNTGAVQPPAGTDIVIHTELFATICDLADAPVHVRVTW
jgi:hypothetical protein